MWNRPSFEVLGAMRQSRLLRSGGGFGSPKDHEPVAWWNIFREHPNFFRGYDTMII